MTTAARIVLGYVSAAIAAGTAGAVLAGAIEPPPVSDPRPCAAVHDRFDAPATGYGEVHFNNSCAAAVQPALQLEIARMHSFEAAVSRFEAVAARDPACAIALWGAAMTQRGNPLGGALGEADRAAGQALVAKAQQRGTGTPREKALIGAMDVYYRPYPDQITRARAYSAVMDTIHAAYPDDPDIAALDGLAIIEGVNLDDKTGARQKRAGAILEAVMHAHPGHPGAPHYLIHAYDSTALAPLAVPAARVYSTLAPASSHAQHMPSHIWSMLGDWDASIQANRRSGAVLDPAAGGKTAEGDIVYAHAFDFIAYARLQRGEDKAIAADLAASGGSAPAVVTARYPLERGDWTAAARVPVPASGAPFDQALVRFARAYGAARAGQPGRAAREITALEALRTKVAAAEGEYWALFVDIYAKTARAWLARARGDGEKGLALMREAASADDGHAKHIYLENKIVPMRESLGDMEAAAGHSAAALAAYQASLMLAPGRYRALLGAAKAAAALGDRTQAKAWYVKLARLTAPGNGQRAGILEAKIYAKPDEPHWPDNQGLE